MQNFDDIKNLWQQSAGSSDLPSAKEVLAEIALVRKKMIRKNLLAIITLALTFGFIAWIGVHYHFESISTNLGIVITLIAIVTGIIFNTQLASRLLKQNDPSLSNSEFLQQLIAFRSQQRLLQTKGISAYFILLTAGILMYMYEFASRDLRFGIIAYCVTLAWIAFNWFYARKRTIRKQEKVINGQIERLEKLMNSYAE